MSHPYPNCDCRLFAIYGFEREKEIAEEVLEQLGSSGTALVTMGIQNNEYVYAHSNAKIEHDDPANWKFIRSIDEISESSILDLVKNRFSVSFKTILCIDDWSYEAMQKDSINLAGAQVARAIKGSDGKWSIRKTAERKTGLRKFFNFGSN